MKIVFCITCKGRLPHIKETLGRNMRDNWSWLCHSKSSFLLLDYNSQDGLADYIRGGFGSYLETGKLAFYQFKEDTPFRMAHAKNMAHRCALLESADVLVNLDADNLTGYKFSDYLWEHFTRTAADPQEIFMWGRMIKGQMAKGISGRLAVTRNAFLVSGGYDEKYATHSPDDKDFNWRLRRLGFCAQEIDPKYLLAIRHNDRMRFREYPQLLGQPHQNYDHNVCQIARVVNGGNVGCGTVYRNFSETPVVISPIPTRIFGIGLHKTATTSLHKAFQILGFSSGHWDNAHWAKTVWNDIVGTGKSAAMEKYYALSDLPFPLLYEQLDRNYPGSKFILTIRDEAEWLESVRGHFRHKFNPFRKQWDTDPFTHKVHTLLYGQRNFDEGVFFARYRRHNAGVLDYFKDRPNDLLVMNMSGNSGGWNDLCKFLNQPVPSVPYPLTMVTPRNYERQN